MSDVDRAADDAQARVAMVIGQFTPTDVPGYRLRYAWNAASALAAAGLLASPEHDAAVAAKALRIVESVCMTTDGDHLEGESEIPVGEVIRMILEAREAFGLERGAGESDADA